ncbi:hypothetical protein, partial [Alicyclobacillus kakegawensis]|uniref:hypothetical protein n=1 Tax=Alicyclobacillus kakegawensis TaxID=392012 RepID=UPI000AAA5512
IERGHEAVATRYWVKIPDEPTVYAIIVVFDSLVRQLQKCDLQSKVKGIRISAADKTIRVKVE